MASSAAERHDHSPSNPKGPDAARIQRGNPQVASSASKGAAGPSAPASQGDRCANGRSLCIIGGFALLPFVGHRLSAVGSQFAEDGEVIAQRRVLMPHIMPEDRPRGARGS